MSEETKLKAYKVCLKVGDGLQNSDNLKTLGECVHFLRKKAGYSKEQLAELLDITWQHLSNIENGRRGVSVDVLLKLRDIFHVSADYLLSGKAITDRNADIAEILQNLDPAFYPHAVDLILCFVKIQNNINNRDI